MREKFVLEQELPDLLAADAECNGIATKSQP